MTQPRLYHDLAAWWHLVSPPHAYAEEAALYLTHFRSVCATGGTMLELGCGGGNNAFHLKQHFSMTLVDISAEMIVASRLLNPECEHHVGDMRQVRMGRTFDYVFVHDAVAYMTSIADLALAIETAAVHCRPGGVALFVPNYVRETFSPGTRCGGSDRMPRGIRYVEWTWDPDASDDTYLVDYAFIIRDYESVRIESDRHIEGLFSRDVWLQTLTSAGFDARAIFVEHSGVEPGTDELFVCQRSD
jgi:SAM-dependent methyltransferase